MQKVMLLNPKGGSGKTTIATGLASLYASHDVPTVLFDHDAQGSSTHWLEKRPDDCAPIQGIAAYKNPVGVTRSWQMRIPIDTKRVIVDTPAGMRFPNFVDLVQRVDSIIVPVIASHIDIAAAAMFIDDLRRTAPVRSGSTRVAVVANRVRRNTPIYTELNDFLKGLAFPYLTNLRDSNNYLRAGERGVGIHELRQGRTRQDQEDWAPIIAWLESGVRGATSEQNITQALIA